MGEPLRQDPLKVRIGSLGALLIGLVSFCYLVQFTTRKALLTSLAALLFVSDTLLAKSSTLLFLDSTLVAFTLLAILAALVASTRVSTKISLGWATLAGLFCGIALGTKWSGVSALIVCYGILAAKTVRGTQCWKTRALGGLLCTAATAVSYFGGWWIHFHLTSAGGDEEPIRQISTSIADYLIRMHQLYYRSHIITGEFSPHPSSSPWWMWPIGLKPIILGRHNGEEILLEANRPLWTLGSFAILWLAGRVAVMRRRGCLNRLEAIGLFGWAAFYLPIIFTSRWLFMYSYLPAAVFALIGLVGILDRTVSQETIQAAALSQRKWLMALGVAALIIAGVF